METAWKIVVIVLAVIGGLALLALLGMLPMHGGMLGGLMEYCR
jgi:hypothetical protein